LARAGYERPFVSKIASRGYMNSGHRKYWKSTPGRSAIKTRELSGINRNHLRHVMGLLAGHCHMKGHFFELELVNSSW
jgi:hypothetical protein